MFSTSCLQGPNQRTGSLADHAVFAPIKITVAGNKVANFVDGVLIYGFCIFPGTTRPGS